MSDLQDVETAVKVLVVGNGGVGKTSLIKRFCKGQYTDEYKKTIGVDFLERQVTMPSMDEPVTLMLWDTAGQEEFGTGAAVLCFSTTDRASFDAIKSWKRKIDENKIDLVDQAVMSKYGDDGDGVLYQRAEVEQLADELGLRLFKASVKNNQNVLELFEYLVDAWNKSTKTPPAAPVTSVSSSSQSSAGPSKAPASDPYVQKEPRKKQKKGKKKGGCIVL